MMRNVADHNTGDNDVSQGVTRGGFFYAGVVEFRDLLLQIPQSGIHINYLKGGK